MWRALHWAWGWPCPPPATIPWWERAAQSFVCPRGAELGELSCRPQGGAGGGRNAEKVWRNAPGWRENICTAHPALPQRGSQGTQTPQPCPQCPQNGAKPQHCWPAVSPLIPLAFFSQIAKERRVPQHAPGHHTHIAAHPCGGQQCPLSQDSHSPRLLLSLEWVEHPHGFRRIWNDKRLDPGPANIGDPPATATSPCPWGHGMHGQDGALPPSMATTALMALPTPQPTAHLQPRLCQAVSLSVPACPLLLLMPEEEEEWASAPRAPWPP